MHCKHWMFLAIGLIVLLPSIAFAEEGAFFEMLGEGYGQVTTFQVVLGDLDGDGDLDALFANQGPHASRVLLNDGSGRFAYTDQELTGNGHGAGLADLDGDGDLDLFIACAYAFGISKPSRVYFNDGTGTFAASQQDLGDTSLSANLVQLVDVDCDGDIDAFVAYLTVPGRSLISRIYLSMVLAISRFLNTHSHSERYSTTSIETAMRMRSSRSPVSATACNPMTGSATTCRLGGTRMKRLPTSLGTRRSAISTRMATSTWSIPMDQLRRPATHGC